MRQIVLALILVSIVTKTQIASPAVMAAEWPPTPIECPKNVSFGTQCLSGRDSAGAYYLIAMPEHWNHILVLHAHGGPALGAPRLERSKEDLQRWAVVVRAGYAWAGSTFRQGGVAVRSAAEDMERLRRIFVEHVAKPEHTILHGQSWGASVAAKAAEIFTQTDDGKRPYDGVMLTSGVLGGGTRSYDFRLDLRVIYQTLCNNHPLPTEPAYPLWMGLPAHADLTVKQLADRANACLGLGIPPAQRSAEQSRKIQTIVSVLQIPESAIQGHLSWATFHFRDIAQHRTAGKNVFGNVGAIYRGSNDDATLNATVLRYSVDPSDVLAFSEDTDLNDKILVPVITVHGVHDPIAFVELEHAFAQTMQRSGSSERLVQTFTDDGTHH